MLYSVIFASLLVFHAAISAQEEDFAMNNLARFAYISKTRSSNHDSAAAIRCFQKFYGFPETGELNDETLEEMRNPRCGFQDVDGKGRMLERSPSGQSRIKWWGSSFTYVLYKGEDLPEAEQPRIIAKAFKIWRDAEPKLKFTKAKYQLSKPTNADLKISFGKEKHSGTPFEPLCTTVFDGKGGILAHAFPPRDGRIHFDDSEKWTDKGGFWSASQSLLYNAVQEIGDALGLNHSVMRS